MLNKQLPAQKNRQQGTILVLAGLALFMLVGFTSLALDSSLLFVARNELQNAADAGALAGTRVLYNNNGTQVNAGANQVAFDGAAGTQLHAVARTTHDDIVVDLHVAAIRLDVNIVIELCSLCAVDLFIPAVVVKKTAF